MQQNKICFDLAGDLPENPAHEHRDHIYLHAPTSTLTRL
jgi:hypothetical protein